MSLYGTNPYDAPEKHGLKIVATADRSSGIYEFDSIVLWADTRTGDLFYAEDSGCS